MRKSEYLPFVYMVALLALETTALPASSYIEQLRATHRGAEADMLQNGMLGFWILFFAILIIGTLYNYFKVYERCVSMPRLNLVLVDRKGPEYFEGVGIVEHRLYKTAAVDIARYLEDKELVDIFNRFVRDRVSKYPGLKLDVAEDKLKILDKIKEYFEGRKNKTKGKKPADIDASGQSNDDDEPKKKLNIRPENLNERTINFHGYSLEYFLENKFPNYFSPKVVEWLGKRNMPIIKIEDFITLSSFETDSLSKDFKKETSELIDFEMIRSYMRYSFNKFEPKEIEWFKSKGFKDLGDLLETNQNKLEHEFNQFLSKDKNITKGIKEKWDALKTKLKVNSYPLKHELIRVKKTVILFEEKFLIEFSRNAFGNFLDVRMARVRALFYQFFLEYLEIDEAIMFAIDRPTQDEHSTEVKEDESAEKHTFMPIKRFLFILPASFGDSFHFRKKKILYEGYDIACPKVAEAEGVFHSLIVHNIALIYVNSCDYTRSTIQEDFHVDIDKFHEIVQAGLVNIIDELDASADKLQVKINNRDKRIKAFKEGSDDGFEQWGADLDKKSNPIYEFKVPQHINGFFAFFAILCIVVGLVIGILLGQWITF